MILSDNDRQTVVRLQSIRERSDYNCTYTATENDVAPLIVPVRDLIDKIRQRLLTS